MHPQLQFKVQKAFNVWGIILILWSLYRVYGPRLPETIDELIMKPLIFLSPVILVLGQEKKPLMSGGSSSLFGLCTGCTDQDCRKPLMNS